MSPRPSGLVHVDSFLLTAFGLHVSLCGEDLLGQNHAPEGTAITCPTCAVLAGTKLGSQRPVRRAPADRRYERAQVARGLLRRGPDRWRPQLTTEQQQAIWDASVLPPPRMPPPEICIGDICSAHIYIFRTSEEER